MRPCGMAGLLFCALPAWAWQARPPAEVVIYPERSAQAQVVSLNESRVAAEITARILRLPPEPGQTLARGALLAELDCRDNDIARAQAEAALAAARADARLATQQLARARALAAEKFISPDLLDTRAAEQQAADARVAVQDAAVQAARRQQEKCRVTAPYPAIVSARLAQEGELAAPGTPLVALIDRSRIQVRAEVQAADIDSLRAAPHIRFAGAQGDLPLRLTRITPALSARTRMAEARLTFSAAPAALPGSQGQVRWRTRAPHLPAHLLARRNGALGVFIVPAGEKTPRFLPLPGAQEGRPAALSALPEGATVVVSGAGALR